MDPGAFAKNVPRERISTNRRRHQAFEEVGLISFEEKPFLLERNFFSCSLLSLLLLLVTCLAWCKALTFTRVAAVTEEIALSGVDNMMTPVAFTSTNSAAAIASSQPAGITEVPVLLLEVLLGLSECANIFRSFHILLVAFLIIFGKLILLVSIQRCILRLVRTIFLMTFALTQIPFF